MVSATYKVDGTFLFWQIISFYSAVYKKTMYTLKFKVRAKKGKVPDEKIVLRNYIYVIILPFGPSRSGGCSG
jgi:hypothetical protein